MKRWAEKAAEERSDRKLVLHTDNESVPFPQRKRRPGMWSWAAAASVAAAIVVGVAVFVDPAPEPEAPVICTVNGERITDPARIEQYTREALEIADENLRRPGAILASSLGDDLTTTRVGEMLNELINNR